MSKRRTKIPLVVLPFKDYERLVEDIEMLSSKRFRQSIARARRDVARGRVKTFTSWIEFNKYLKAL